MIICFLLTDRDQRFHNLHIFSVIPCHPIPQLSLQRLLLIAKAKDHLLQTNVFSRLFNDLIAHQKHLSSLHAYDRVLPIEMMILVLYLIKKSYKNDHSNAYINSKICTHFLIFEVLQGLLYMTI